MIDNYINIVKEWKNANKKNDYQRRIAKRKKLKNNSQELAKIFSDLSLLKSETHLFELGCGSGRNLHYLLMLNSEIHISGNDLDKEQCFKYMKDIVKNNINFIELDTLALVNNHLIHPDIVLSSDHLMHIPSDVIESIANSINNNWKSKFIVLRESTVSREKIPKVFVHDYVALFGNFYDIIFDQISKTGSIYRILVMQRKV